jgi:hypothetical protein
MSEPRAALAFRAVRELRADAATRTSRVVVVATLVLGVAIPASALAALPHALGKLSAAKRQSLAIPVPLRPLTGAFQTDIDRSYLLAAKAYIGADDKYYFVQGTGVVSGNEASAQSAAPVTQFWLYPRRPVSDPNAAQWLICYGCDLTSWSAKLDVVWQQGPIVIGRLTR